MAEVPEPVLISMATAEEKKEAQRIRSRRWYEKNRERHRELGLKWREENLEQERARRRAAYEANRDAVKARSKAWAEANPEKRREYVKRHYHKDVDYSRKRMRVAENKRRAITEGKLTTEEWQGVLEEFGYRCAYCQADGKLDMDHLRAISRAGRHVKDNVVPACPSCNRSKGAKTLLEFAAVVPIKMRRSARV